MREPAQNRGPGDVRRPRSGRGGGPDAGRQRDGEAPGPDGAAPEGDSSLAPDGWARVPALWLVGDEDTGFTVGYWNVWGIRM